MKWWKRFAPVVALTTIVFLTTQTATANVLELPKHAPVFDSAAFRVEGATPTKALRYSRYLIPEFIDSMETVNGDYYCYTSTIASYEEQLKAIEAVSLQGFAIASKRSDAVELASREISSHRCHAPSTLERFTLKLTGMVHLIREQASSVEPWEAIVLEGEADIHGVPQKVFIAKIRKLPTVS